MRVSRVRYHRNGSAGEGFYTVEFKMREGRTARAMVGIIFAEPEGVPMTRYAVIDPARPDTTYRGDLFADDLRAAVLVADLTGEAYQEESRTIVA